MEAVRRAFGPHGAKRPIQVLPETDSTNRAAFQLAQTGAADGTLVLADAQTAGRGRLGRVWHSPPGANLYCSLVLRREVPPDRLPDWLSWIPLLSAAGVAQAVRQASNLHATVKWPNDVLVSGRKISGILCESAGVGTTDIFVIIGVGLNVNLPAHRLPDELRSTATSLAHEAGRPFDRAVLAALLIGEIERRVDWLRAGERDRMREEYRSLSATIGQRVRVELAHGAVIEGSAEDVAGDGALLVRSEAEDPTRPARYFEVRAGDVTHLRSAPGRAASPV
ncbi:biotin--[acetyl-CoA-carboxylase] ligase [Candidatus Nitrospira bockiana]